MATENVSKLPVRVGPIRVSYPCVFQPRAFQAGQTPKYSIALMFDKQNEEHKKVLATLHKQMQEALAEKWPDEKTRPRNPLIGDTRSPIKDGDKTLNTSGIPISEANPEYAGHYIVRASSTRAPRVVDRGLNTIMDSNEIYGGCFCNVNINVYTYDKGVNKGVTFGLNGVQKHADGESFAGGNMAAEDMFESGGADDPANYGDDPFAAPAGDAVTEDDLPF